MVDRRRKNHIYNRLNWNFCAKPFVWFKCYSFWWSDRFSFFFFHSHRMQPATMRRHDDARCLYGFYFISQNDNFGKNPHHRNSMRNTDNEYFTKCLHWLCTNVMAIKRRMRTRMFEGNFIAFFCVFLCTILVTLLLMRINMVFRCCNWISLFNLHILKIENIADVWFFLEVHCILRWCHVKFELMNFCARLIWFSLS